MEIHGLKNEGENNCYVNVIIQAIWNLYALREDLISIVHAHKSNNCTLCELSVFLTQTLLVNMQYSGMKNLSVSNLKLVLNSRHSKEVLNNWGCAIETFEQILEAMHTESSENSGNPCELDCISHNYFGLSLRNEL